jgi:hypothetical protein
MQRSNSEKTHEASTIFLSISYLAACPRELHERASHRWRHPEQHMSTRSNPLEKYLVRTILMIDPDEEIGNRLSGLLSRLGGKAGTGEKSATVTNLQDAEAYIAKQNPDVVIIDPAIDSVHNVLRFHGRHRKRFVWVIHTHDSWWQQHESDLPSRGTEISEHTISSQKTSRVIARDLNS